MHWVALGLHGLFWSPYLLRGQLDRAQGKAQEGPAAHAAPGATRLVQLHTLAFGLLYVAIAAAALGAEVWPWPTALRAVGVPLALAAWWLSVRALMVFRSWRVRAVLTADHELCTEGPFRFIRHPIYTALGLMALATFLLVPGPIALAALVLQHTLSEARARAEERLLTAAFGERYVAYLASTARFFPGLY